MTEQEIRERLAAIVGESLRIDPARVTDDAYLNDLGAESLDLLEITMEAEDQFNVLFPQKTILQIAQETFGEGVLVRDGHLTEEGLKLLRRRTPEVDSLFGTDSEATLADVNRMFLRVGVWVRMIHGLMEHSPRECPQCGTAFGKAVAGRLKCSQCATEREITPGDELNRRWVSDYYEEACVPTAAPVAAVPAPTGPDPMPAA
jgi:acyl carrier protein